MSPLAVPNSSVAQRMASAAQVRFCLGARVFGASVAFDYSSCVHERFGLLNVGRVIQHSQGIGVSYSSISGRLTSHSALYRVMYPQ